jgi:chitinase
MDWFSNLTCCPIGILLLILMTASDNTARSQQGRPQEIQVIAYLLGRSHDVDIYPLDQLSHICYSFLHLRGRRLVADRPRDSAGIAHLVSLKKQYPRLKIILSFGGWGACATCSEVFAEPEGRREFAQSAMALVQKFDADGIDLDWEYPAVQGYPGHPFSPEDKHNFTQLVRELRAEFGTKYELSFAAGAFLDCLRNSIEWNDVMPVVDRVHLMTYDFVNGYSTVTGHHTPLFSSLGQVESTDRAVRYLDSLGIPKRKIVIGAAFYARVWENVPDTNNGLFQQGKFKEYVVYRDFAEYFDPAEGFVSYWDSTAQAPYTYSSRKKTFATFDDVRSVALKARYAIRENLGGVMFWELTGDTPVRGLLEAIERTKHPR